MTINSQLSANEPKKQTNKQTNKKTPQKTKQTTRTGTESETWTSHGGFSVGREEWGERGQGRRSIIGRH